MEKEALNAILPDLVREAGRMERENKPKAPNDDKLYWILHKKEKKAYGPYSGKSLVQVKIFRASALLAPYGSTRKGDWHRADEYPELIPFLEKKEEEDAELY